jgi:PAS domain S-box-containing protein
VHWQYNPYVVPLVVTVAVATGLALYVRRRRLATGATWFTLLMLAVAEWSLGYALELGAVGLGTKVLWAKVEYLGIVTVPVTWLAFVLHYTGQGKWLIRCNLSLLVICPAIVLLMVWTNDVHGLIWRTIRLDTSAPFPTLSLTYGAGFWVHTVYSYATLLGSTILLVRALVRSPHLFRGQAAAMLVGAFAPWVGNALYLSDLSPFPALDLTPFAFMLTGLAIAWALFRFRLFDIVPVARDAVVQSMSDVVIVLDVQDRVVDINPAAERIIERVAPEVIGRPVAEVFSGWSDLAECCRNEAGTHSEVVLGEAEARRAFDLCASPLRDRHGHLTGRLIVLRDITERRSVEEMWGRYEFIVNTSREFMALVTRDYVYEAVNESYCMAHNRARDEILGRTVAELWGPEVFATIVKSYFDRCFAGEVVSYTRWFEFSALGLRCMDVTYYPYCGSAGTVTHAVVVSRDTTERQRVEDALQRRNRELTTLYEAATAISSSPLLDRVLQTVAEQMTQALDSGECALYLWDREEDRIVTLIDYSVVWPGKTDAVCTTYGLSDYPAARRVLETRQPLVLQRAELEAYQARPARRDNGQALILLMLPMVARDRVLGLVELWTEEKDYTPDEIRLAHSLATQAAIAIENARLYEQAQQELVERRRMEDTLRERTLQLEATNKELEAFSYSVSHDLHAPLRTIDGFSQILLEDYAGVLDAEGRDYLCRVRAASQRMGQLIEDILTLSRIARCDIHRRTVDMSAVAREIAVELKQREPDRQVDFLIEEDVVVSGSDGLLRVLLENLLGNAWKFTSKHARARIEFGTTQQDGTSVYFVRDDGAGFNMAYADRLFGAFQRLHSMTEFDGTGIGLATAQRIVHRHGGRVWAEGAVERGATFYFSL